MKIALLCNPTEEGRKSVALADTLIPMLKRKGIACAGFTTYWPEVWTEFTDIWILGGDGTVNYFINHHSDTGLPLSVFPGGSGNDFHWMLYGDVSLEEQVNQVLAAAPQPVDAGSCNGRLFLNGVGIGFDGAIVEDLLGKKKIAGKASYNISILKNIVGYREPSCRIVREGRETREDILMISVANSSRYGGGFMVAPKASVTDGLLDLNIVGRIAPLKRIRYLPVIEKGEHPHLPFVQYGQFGNVLIESAEPIPAHIDGEFFSATRFDFQCLPGRFSFRL
ncbi:MAG TPA: YegS/Rv2252/BmrU family lipid kinase [Chitinophagaceae bacterium]|jgi:YegS/Rv2252/BmrU family lipid kinase|nr:YegS/Rv2252/BmrU family lipid kinase [Chitinophagaceae bacterium]